MSKQTIIQMQQFKVRLAYIILFLYVLFVPDLYSAIDFSGTNPGPKAYVRKIPDVNTLRIPGVSQSQTAQTIGATGTKKIAFVLVDFAVVASTDGTSSGGNPMDSEDISYAYGAGLFLNDYYKFASYGKLDLEVTYFWNGSSGTSLSGTETPCQVTSSMSYYGNPMVVEGEVDEHYGTKLLIEEVLGMYPEVNSSNYDCAVIVHSGYGEETTYMPGDIWSVCYPLSTSVNGFSQCIVIPARQEGYYITESTQSVVNSYGRRWASTRGVLCHEFGHALGLPSLYSTTSSYSERMRVGGWCLMDSGHWVISSDNEWAYWFPSFPSAWCRQYLGWITPVELIIKTNEQIISWPIETHDNPPPPIIIIELILLNNSSSEKSLYKIPILDSDSEYFLIHTSTFALFHDTYLEPLGGRCYVDAPGEGLLIWHIDESVSSNDDSDHRMVDLEEADTTDPSENSGDSTDPWTSGEFSIERSLSNTGATSYISVYVSTFVPGKYTIFFATFPGFCTVTGYVTDLANRGVDSVQVDFTGTQDVTVYTDLNGLFRTNLMEGSYNISLSKPGYKIIQPISAFTLKSHYRIPEDFIAIVTNQYEDVLEGDVKLVNNIFNPATNEIVTFLFNLSESGEITYIIYALDGATVKKYTEYFGQGINCKLQWDGKNQNAETVASGIYIVDITGPGIKKTGKICVIR